MEHELEKMALKHQDDIREVKSQFKDILAEAEQKQVQLTMAIERERNSWEEERIRLAHEHRVAVEAVSEQMDREMAVRADIERAKLEHVKRDMMDIVARQNRVATDPILHEKTVELDRKEVEVRNLKIELAQEKQTNEILNARYKDETKNLREKLTSKGGLIGALKQFELSARQTILREAGVVPSAQDILQALKTMPPQEAQFVVSSSAVKLCASEDEVFDRLRGLSQQQIKRMFKKLKLLYEPNELAPLYRNFNIKQQDQFLELVLDKMAFQAIISFLLKLDSHDFDFIVFSATNRYLIKSNKSIAAFIASLTEVCQKEYRDEIMKQCGTLTFEEKQVKVKDEEPPAPVPVQTSPQVPPEEPPERKKEQTEQKANTVTTTNAEQMTKENIITMLKRLDHCLIRDVIEACGFLPSSCDLVRWLNRMRLADYEDFLFKAQLEPRGASAEALAQAINARAAQQKSKYAGRFHVHL